MHCLPQYWRDLFGRNGSGSFCFQPLHFPSLSPVPAHYVVEGPARSDRGTSYFLHRTPDHQRPPAPSRPNQDSSLHPPAWIGRRSRSYRKSFAGRVFLQESNLLLCRIDCPCRSPLFARLREYFCSGADHSRSTHSFRRRQPSRPRPHPGCLNPIATCESKAATVIECPDRRPIIMCRGSAIRPVWRKDSPNNYFLEYNCRQSGRISAGSEGDLTGRLPDDDELGNCGNSFAAGNKCLS